MDDAAGRGEGMEVLGAAACLELLKTERFGRVAVSVAALPSIFPVQYHVSDGCVVFAAVAGTRLSTATDGAVVAFEADSVGGDSEGWSVVVVGEARRAPVEAMPALTGRSAWAAVPGAHWVLIPAEKISGRRLRSGRSDWSAPPASSGDGDSDLVSALRQEIEDLRLALASRTTISTAVGLLMAGGATSAAAFDYLRRASQDRNTKLRVVAAEIVDRHDRRMRNAGGQDG